ncbi:MAG: hypothetical protein AB8E87_03460 [Prochlorococcus sp.]
MSPEDSTENGVKLVEEPNRKYTIVISAIVLFANVSLVAVLLLDRFSPAAHTVINGWLHASSDAWINAFA